MSELPEIYVYKMVTDNGGAPYVARGLLSLAICKPKIRSTAEPGALIFGFGAKHYGERLIYIAEVTEKPDVGDYYRKAEYAPRPDCIYHEVNGRAERKASARYHAQTDERKRDVGMNFEKAFVLLSDDFRYLGHRGTADYKRDYPAIKNCVENLKQGHRRFHEEALRDELLRLKRSTWRLHGRMKVGHATEDDRTGRCNTDCGSGAVRGC